MTDHQEEIRLEVIEKEIGIEEVIDIEVKVVTDQIYLTPVSHKVRCREVLEEIIGIDFKVVTEVFEVMGELMVEVVEE